MSSIFYSVFRGLPPFIQVMLQQLFMLTYGSFMKYGYPQIIYFHRIFQYQPSSVLLGYPHGYGPRSFHLWSLLQQLICDERWEAPTHMFGVLFSWGLAACITAEFNMTWMIFPGYPQSLWKVCDFEMGKTPNNPL